MTAVVRTQQRSAGNSFEVTLDRGSGGNALNVETVEALHQALDQVERADASAVVLRGIGRHFCTGLDLSGIESETDASLLYRLCRIALLLERLYSASYATIAISHGVAAGAGADLIAACDHRIGVCGGELRFPGPRFGAVLGSRWLAGVIGHGPATTLLSTERRVDTLHALRIGLLTQTRDNHAQADQAVDRIVADVCAVPSDERLVLLSATRPPPDDSRLADLVRSLAGRPGLKQRLIAYIESSAPLKNARRERSKEQ